MKRSALNKKRNVGTTKRSAFVTTLLIVMVGWVHAVPPGTDDEISARLLPFGSVCRSGEDCAAGAATAASGPMGGQQIYDQFCFACHAAGVGGAPLLGDRASWGDRADKDMDALMLSTLNGLNAMPPKGTCMSCSDEELGEAVQYMLDQL